MLKLKECHFPFSHPSCYLWMDGTTEVHWTGTRLKEYHETCGMIFFQPYGQRRHRRPKSCFCVRRCLLKPFRVGSSKPVPSDLVSGFNSFADPFCPSLTLLGPAVRISGFHQSYPASSFLPSSTLRANHPTLLD